MNEQQGAGLPTPFMSYQQFPFDGGGEQPAVCDVRVFCAPNIGREVVTAVVTVSGRSGEASIEEQAAQIAGKVVETFEADPTRLIYVEYHPAVSEALIQARLITPSSPARFVKVRFTYSREEGFGDPRREQIEVTEVAYLTHTPVEAWHRELEEEAACNRLFAMLGEHGPARTLELLECAIKRQRDTATDAVNQGAAPAVSAEGWERLRLALVQLVFCPDAPVLPEEEAAQ
jgi:hypothetical protein